MYLGPIISSSNLLWASQQGHTFEFNKKQVNHSDFFPLKNMIYILLKVSQKKFDEKIID